MAVRLTDVSGLNEERVECASYEELEAWITAHAHGEPRCYDLLCEDHRSGVRFALGEGWCGWIFAVEGSQGEDMWTLEEGAAGGEDIDVWMDGETMPVISAATATRARLLEVLAHYLTDNERPEGRWVDDRGRPERRPAPGRYTGPRPEARGRFVRAFVAAICAQPQRSEPDAAVEALIVASRDQDMAAYLYAAARIAYMSGLSVYDWWPERPTLQGRRITLGTLASGEPVFFERGEVIMIDEEGHRYRYRGLNGFLDEWWYKANERGEETCMDAYLEP